MKVTIEVELQPFKTPNFVLAKAKPGRREDGLQEPPKYALSDLDAMTLWCMCEQFKQNVS